MVGAGFEPANRTEQILSLPDLTTFLPNQFICEIYLSYIVFKMSEIDGVPAWGRFIDGAESDIAYGLATMSDGSVISCG